MREVLIRKFHEYLKESRPDLLDSLAGQEEITAFVQQQVLAQEPVIDQLLAAEAPALPESILSRRGKYGR